MKNILRSIAMAFSMFSKIPMPKVEWKSENMRYALAAMPLVGIVTGAIMLIWHLLCTKAGIGNILHAAGLTVLPIIITGGIHLDGYCDTVDALSSHAEPEKKRQILKDPHTGAFAVIWCGIYILAYFAVMTEITTTYEILTAGLFTVASRAVTAFAAAAGRAAKKEGLYSEFNGSAKKTAVIITSAAFFALAAAAAVFLSGYAAVSILAIPAVSAAVWAMAKKEFNGMSGDILGFMLTASEIAAVFIYTVIKAVIG